MTQTLRVSPTLVLDRSRNTINCAGCGHALADAGGGTHWKDVAVLAAMPAVDQPGWSSSVHKDLLLRRFCCPSCASLLDTEVSLPDDPFLYDVVHR